MQKMTEKTFLIRENLAAAGTSNYAAQISENSINFSFGSVEEESTKDGKYSDNVANNNDLLINVDKPKKLNGNNEEERKSWEFVQETSVIQRSFRQVRKSSSVLRELASDALFMKTDKSCTSCTKFNVCARHGSFSLINKYEDIPEYMRGNPYVQAGYRPPQLTHSLIFKSLFHLDNETINIWSHLIGLIFFTHCQIYDNIYSLPRIGAHWDDHLVLSLGLLCFQVCMTMSAFYHMFCCVSDSHHSTWLTMDLLGITTGILGFYLPGIYYGFYCFHTLHHVYLSIFFLLTFATIVAPFLPDYASHKYYWHRLVLYGAVAAYGLLPSAHWIYLHGGWHAEIVMRFLPNVAVLYFLCILGVCFYIFMIPERWLPGRFDFFGWSHQWWHLLILMAMIWWRSAGIELLEFRKSTSCSDYL